MNLILKFKKFKVEESIIISGEPRSGTTWLLDTLAKIPNALTNWEPLHHEYEIVPKKWKWGDRVFIPPNDKTKKYFNLIKNILVLKIHTKRTLRHHIQPISVLMKGQFVITKFIRANLLLPYIVTNFKLKNKPIFILRHPIDTCLSQIRLYSSLPYYNWINNERYLKEDRYLQQLSSKLEYEIALWCINICQLLEDKTTLQQLNIVFYSDLLLNTEEEIRKILNNLTCVNKEDINTIISSMNFKQASRSDFNKDYIPNPEKQLQKNIEKLSAEEKDKIQKVFDHFNFKLYDAYSVFPKKEILLT